MVLDGPPVQASRSRPGTSCRRFGVRVTGPVLAAWLLLGPAAPAQSTWLRRHSNTPNYLTSVAHGNGTFVAVGDTGAITRSTDAVSWTPAGSGATVALRAVIQAGGQFIVAGEGGRLMTSPDGVSWTTRPTGMSGFLSGLASNGTRHVGVGANGAIITSLDASNWSPANSGTGAFLQGVSHAAGLFVAAGAGGTILTSPDGLSWTARPSPTTSFLVAAGHFRGRHYVVGQGGVIASSADGGGWQLEASGTLQMLRAFATDGTTAVVCGDGGLLLRSADGTTWNPVASGQATILGGATFAAGAFVVVGEPTGGDGMILTAEQGPGIRWSAGAVTVAEAAGSVTLTLERLGLADTSASVGFQTAPGSATAGVDFTPASGTAEFAAGAQSASVVIPITNNPEAEPAESFTVTLAAPTPAGLVLYQPVTATVTITDAQDSDYDGLPDEWEILHFGAVGLHGPDDDPDGDDNANARELADGTNPADPQSAAYRLTLGVSAGLGTVSASPQLPVYPRGTTVTLTSAGSGEFTFASWQGDAGGAANPLVFAITGDAVIRAAFELSLGHALDAPSLAWTTSGSGPPWAGQALVTSDGADAAGTGGLSLGQQSAVEATVYGPAGLTFDWKVSTSLFDSYRFFIDGSSRASAAGESDWTTKTFFVGAGTHTIRWTYAKNSTSTAGSNQAWLDQVRLSYGYDDWQLAYFNSSERADPALSGPGADPENDGTPNLSEYLFNLHPKHADAGSPNLPVLGFSESGGQDVATLTWSQHQQRAANVEVTVEFSPSLAAGSWQALAAPVQPIALTGAMETMQATCPAPPPNTPGGFYRLRVTLLP